MYVSFWRLCNGVFAVHYLSVFVVLGYSPHGNVWSHTFHKVFLARSVETRAEL